MSSRFTASANRFIRWVAIPALLAGYVAYLAVDRAQPKDSERDRVYVAKSEGIAAERGRISALILGGSNAYYALSAKTLSETDGLNWYNFTLLAEGDTQASYQRAIETAFQTEDERLAIRKIVYSSILPLHRSYIAQYRGNPNDSIVTGATDAAFSLRPDEPMYRYLALALRPPRQADLDDASTDVPDRQGDLDFSSVRCTRNVGASATRLESPDTALDFYDGTAEFLRRLFPNAELFMVMPSEYLTDPEAHAAWGKALEARWAERGPRPYRLIVQPTTPDKSMLCRMSHHTNELGRDWRTADLIARMQG